MIVHLNQKLGEKKKLLKFANQNVLGYCDKSVCLRKYFANRVSELKSTVAQFRLFRGSLTRTQK